jgi:hypothetical protein
MYRPLSTLMFVFVMIRGATGSAAQTPLRATSGMPASGQWVARATQVVDAPSTQHAVVFDSVRATSRRSTVTGAIVGALIGGVASAGYILNATAEECVTSGPPCPKKNHVVLHTFTITAGGAAGAFLGAKVGGWIRKRL